MNERDYYKKLHDKNVRSGKPNKDFRIQYKILRNKNLKSIRKAKYNTIAESLESNQNKNLKKWKVLRNLFPTKKN